MNSFDEGGTRNDEGGTWEPIGDVARRVLDKSRALTAKRDAIVAASLNRPRANSPSLTKADPRSSGKAHEPKRAVDPDENGGRKNFREIRHKDGSRP
ncbi:hypothetical protein [Azorhizobium caulinodans]|uniref:hypothetical protein n=1 Tax=Azorhizobium caulinodans TaxID=7 RepID=UPI0005C4BBA0|nr:hypothetical protein [Azorhizobium caulinodans]